MEYAEPEGDEYAEPENGGAQRTARAVAPPARRRRHLGDDGASPPRDGVGAAAARRPSSSIRYVPSLVSCEHVSVCMDHGVLGALAHMRRSGTHITLGLSALWRAHAR